MRHLIVCCDGTWNTPEQESVTNVRRLYNALADADEKGNDQLRHYQPGVGNHGGLLRRLLGGGLGAGLSRDVMSVYHWLTTTYRPGDRIALFGFSRGAYTARSLAGMVAACGLLDATDLDEPDRWTVIERMYEGRYRRRRRADRCWRENLTFRFDPDDESAIPVTFIGAWDTVGALGIPEHLAVLSTMDPPQRYAFHDVTLNPHVRYARHAMAMDERRGPFAPTLWEERPARKQDIKQVWFPGSHLDVGGGHRETGLSDGALKWMIKEARKTERLAFHGAMVAQIQPNPLDVLHDDDRGLFGPALAPVLEPLLVRALDVVFERCPRAVPLINPEVRTPSVATSAYHRQQNPGIASGPYRSTHVLARGESRTISVLADQPWNETGLYLRAGDYRFTTHGEWFDADISSGAAGTTGLRRFNLLVEKLRLVGSLLGPIERLYRYIWRNPVANFPFTRREESLPWMSLVGVVANDAVSLGNGSTAHERIPIGSGTERSVTSDGYLYTFANDAWAFYGNNKGRVDLTVERRR